MSIQNLQIEDTDHRKFNSKKRSTGRNIKKDVFNDLEVDASRP